MFGLPELYSKKGVDSFVKGWDLMADGYGDILGFSKHELGWIEEPIYIGNKKENELENNIYYLYPTTSDRDSTLYKFPDLSSYDLKKDSFSRNYFFEYRPLEGVDKIDQLQNGFISSIKSTNTPLPGGLIYLVNDKANQKGNYYFGTKTEPDIDNTEKIISFSPRVTLPVDNDYWNSLYNLTYPSKSDKIILKNNFTIYEIEIDSLNNRLKFRASLFSPKLLAITGEKGLGILTKKNLNYEIITFNRKLFKDEEIALKCNLLNYKYADSLTLYLNNHYLCTEKKNSSTVTFPYLKIDTLDIKKSNYFHVIVHGKNSFNEKSKKVFFEIDTNLVVENYRINKKRVEEKNLRQFTDLYDMKLDSFNVKNVNDNLVYIDNCSFYMGGGIKLKEYSGISLDSYPLKKVSIDSFYISKYETTQEMFSKIMGYNPSFHKGREKPIENITWYEAVKFCNKLSEFYNLEKCYKFEGKLQICDVDFSMDGQTQKVECDFSKNGFRLPTHAEWECAASGNRDRYEFYYSGSDSLKRVAWKVSYPLELTTTTIGTLQPNYYGLYDMSGNVNEFCWDWDYYWGLDYYNNNYMLESNNPRGPISGRYKILKGGDYESVSPIFQRASVAPEEKSKYTGFRLVRSKK